VRRLEPLVRNGLRIGEVAALDRGDVREPAPTKVPLADYQRSARRSGSRPAAPRSSPRPPR
jgi:hypothetical protein